MLRTFCLTLLAGAAVLALVLALRPEDQGASGAERKSALGSDLNTGSSSGAKSKPCTACDFPSP
jgi:hypothetical protein